MGEVWRAEHIETGESVAIKLLTDESAGRDRFVRAFQREMTAMARLNHPAVIDVYDRGELPETDADDASGFGMYLVLELAEASLSDIDHSYLGWRHVRAVLLSTLDALAHAHARGLVHRDLKPDNLLFVRTERGLQLKLADFGMVRRFDDLDLSQRAVRDEWVFGTPGYVAPEQIQGQWRDQGPWTDLYSLGCLAYWLTCGEKPFSGSVDDVLDAHLKNPRPELNADVPLPEGFEDWLFGLMAIDPDDRPAFAADAARALVELENADASVQATLWEESHRWEALFDESVAGARTDAPDESDTIVSEVEPTEVVSTASASTRDRGAGSRFLGDGESTPGASPVPERWERPAGGRRVKSPRGLAAAGLRWQVPMVGRKTERDRIWEQLRQVANTGRPRAVIVDGASGLGKTRLAAWIGHRAHELGAARLLHGVHTRMAGPRAGIRRMIADHLRCTGLSRRQILRRIRGLLYSSSQPDDDGFEAIQLAEFIGPAADPEYDASEAKVRFSSADQRHEVFRRFLHRTTAGRPVYCLLDDVHLATETPEFVRAILDAHHDRPLPVVFAMTARTSARGGDGEGLATLRDHDAVVSMDLAEMSNREMEQLASLLLPADPDPAKVVAASSSGNPLFALQLVDDWIEQGILAPSPEGLVAADDASHDIPDTVDELLERRLERMLGHRLHRLSDRLSALEYAAALGQSVEHREWDLVCLHDELPVDRRLLDDLVEHGHARRDEQGFSFSQESLRGVIEANARRHSRWAGRHRRCAEMLAMLYGADRDETKARRAHHLLEAGDIERAQPLFDDAMEHFRATGNHERAFELCDRYGAAVDTRGLDDDHPLRLSGWIGRIRQYSRLQRFEAMLDVLERAVPVAEADGRPIDRARIYYYRAIGAWMAEGDVDTAIDRARTSLELHRESDDEKGIAQTLVLVAELLRNRDELTESNDYYEKALKKASALTDEFTISVACLGLAINHAYADDFETALSYLDRARRLREKLGNQNALATCILYTGLVNQMYGNYEDAAPFYERGLQLARRLGLTTHILITHVKMGTVYAHLDRPRRAIESLQLSLEKAGKHDRDDIAAASHLAMLHPLAALDDWERWDRHFDAATDKWSDDVDEAVHMLELVAETEALCRADGVDDRTERFQQFRCKIEEMYGN